MLLKAILCVVCMGVHMCVCDACTCLQGQCANTCVQSRRSALVTSVVTLRLIQDLSLNLEFMRHLTGRQRAPVILLSLPSSWLGLQAALGQLRLLPGCWDPNSKLHTCATNILKSASLSPALNIVSFGKYDPLSFLRFSKKFRSA